MAQAEPDYEAEMSMVEKLSEELGEKEDKIIALEKDRERLIALQVIDKRAIGVSSIMLMISKTHASDWVGDGVDLEDVMHSFLSKALSSGFLHCRAKGFGVETAIQFMEMGLAEIVDYYCDEYAIMSYEDVAEQLRGDFEDWKDDNGYDSDDDEIVDTYKDCEEYQAFRNVVDHGEGWEHRFHDLDSIVDAVKVPWDNGKGDTQYLMCWR